MLVKAGGNRSDVETRLSLTRTDVEAGLSHTRADQAGCIDSSCLFVHLFCLLRICCG